MNRVALVAGLCVVGGYLVGSVPSGYLMSRSRLRRDLRRIDQGRPPRRPASEVVVAVVAAAKVVAVSVVAWRVMAHVAPGHGHVFHFSGVGEFSDQVLTAWQSVALWTGAAALAGDLAPPTARFGRGDGLLPAAGLLVVYTPATAAIAFAAVAVIGALTRSIRRAVVAAALAAVGWCWLAWGFDWHVARGLPQGPELSLWTTVVAGIVVALTVSTATR